MKVVSIILGIVMMVGGAVMLFDLFDKSTGVATAEAGPVKEVVLLVEGMTCAGCAVSVKMALKDLNGVKETKVDVEKGEAMISFTGSKVTIEQMIKAINSIGFIARKPNAG